MRTIPPEDEDDTPLVRDVAEAIRARDHLLACINRGVLIGEISNKELTGSDPIRRLALNIANWLLSGKTPETVIPEVRLELLDMDSPDHYVAAEIYWRDTKCAVVHVVYMDRASLLEHWTDTGGRPRDYRQGLPSSKIDVTPILSPDRRSRNAAFEGCLTGARAGLRPEHGLRIAGSDRCKRNVAFTRANRQRLVLVDARSRGYSRNALHLPRTLGSFLALSSRTGDQRRT